MKKMHTSRVHAQKKANKIRCLIYLLGITAVVTPIVNINFCNLLHIVFTILFLEKL